MSPQPSPACTPRHATSRAIVAALLVVALGVPMPLFAEGRATVLDGLPSGSLVRLRLGSKTTVEGRLRATPESEVVVELVRFEGTQSSFLAGAEGAIRIPHTAIVDADLQALPRGYRWPDSEMGRRIVQAYPVGKALRVGWFGQRLRGTVGAAGPDTFTLCERRSCDGAHAKPIAYKDVESIDVERGMSPKTRGWVTVGATAAVLLWLHWLAARSQ